MAGQGKRKYNILQCTQSIQSVYELNKSYTNNITIGLENKKIGGELLPVSRFRDDNFVSIRLTVFDWHLFEEYFIVTERFF